MNWYKEYHNEWKEIIETVAREMGRTEQMVEKDTIQSMFLHELSKTELPFVFKGGTSLSKAYGLIDRFSEDIMSRYEYNRYVFKYDSLYAEIPLEIIIETSYYNAVYPVEKHTVGSFVGKFCRERNVLLPIPFEAAEVIMDVQSVERTFIDKVFAVCDYRIQNMQDRDSRHLYDICKMIERVELNQQLDELIYVVRNDRMKTKNSPSAQLKYDIPEMLKEIIDSRFYEADYKDITQKLLYENVSYDYAIKHGVAVIANSDLFKYKKK